MLNEGYALYKSLKRCGVPLTNRHPDVKEPGRKDGLVVGLDEKGKVTRLEYRKAEEVAKLWTIREGMQNSFPVLKLQRPLWKLARRDKLRNNLRELKKDETEKKKLLNQQRHELNVTSLEINWWKRLQGRVNELRQFFETTNSDFSALPQLMDRFLLVAEVESFIEGLFDKIRKYQKEIPYNLLEDILVGNKWNANDQEYRAEIPFILDVSDWEDFSVRVASPKMEAFVSECLFKMRETTSQKNNRPSEATPPSALSGSKMELEDDKFPSPKLPIIGNAYLFAVNDQTPCQTRYGRTSTEIIPIGRKEATSIQNSLNWITEDERLGKTWCPVPGLSEADKDLLIVYLENKPDLANKAYMLGGMTKDSFSERTYEATAREAIGALQGEKLVKASDVIKLFALHKADPGRTQMSLHRVYTIAELVRADMAWREAANNLPNISLPFFRQEIEKAIAREDNVTTSISQFLEDKRLKTIFLSPRCPFPADLVYVTQRQWIRYGGDSSSVSGVSLADVYDVFFTRQNEKNHSAKNLLGLTLQRIQPLFIGLGNAEHKKETRGFNTEARSKALTAISAFAIYLSKLGIKKEDYMKGTFFYVGKFLSLVDTLHYEYCDKVRGGSIPPQLLGNAHLQIALDNPISALDMLSRRIGIYQAWARKEKGDQVNLARWAVAQIGKVSDLLADEPLPDATTSEDRAQILLGYLSRPEKKAENGPESLEEVTFENK